MSDTKIQSRHVVLATFALTALSVIPGALKAQVWPTIPATPIAIQAQADPNLLLTLDDSGSMQWAYVPDTPLAPNNTMRYLSTRINPLAYNPFTVYDQPYDPDLMDGTTLPTSYTKAWINGYNQACGGVNLQTSYVPVTNYNPAGCGQGTTGAGPTGAYFYAYYGDLGPGGVVPNPGDNPSTYVYGTVPPTPACLGTAVGSRPSTDSCYVKVNVNGNAAHMQNFANWYSFYKTRNLMVASAANRAYFYLNPSYRITWQALNTCNAGFNTTCKGWDGTNYTNNFRPLSDAANKKRFFKWLSRLPANSGTPLRTAVKRAGDWVLNSDSAIDLNGPWANAPGSTINPVSSCRASFHVVMTDGIWNSDTLTIGNIDGTAKALPDGVNYDGVMHPYSDANSNDIADLAFKYWSTDLDKGTKIQNNLIPYFVKGSTDYWDPRNDPATWQHLVTFTVGIGLGGWLTSSNRPEWAGDMFSGDYTNLKGGSLAWPATCDNCSGNVADLWHAAINSRGLFFSADSPRSIQSAFAQILNRIGNNTTSLGQIGASTTRVTSSTVSVDSKFVPAEWYSTLTAYKTNPDGTRGAVLWVSDSTFTSSAGRNIFTSAGGVGKVFDAGFFSTYGSSLLGTTNVDVFNWLRGDRSKEGMTSASIVLRKRTQLLGDVVGSDVVVSGEIDQGYLFLSDTSSGSSAAARAAYPNYVTSKQAVVFVGSNDGMVHAFDASNGAEKFAFIPAAVQSRLKDLADSNYVHEYYVDGPLALYDAYLGGAWKTILIGGLGSGGRGWFALDVTSVITGGSFAASDVIFDFKNVAADTNLKEIGYSFPMPVIGRTIAGEWVALMANGYGDNTAPNTGDSCRAVLLIYSLTSNTLSKVDTGVGTCAAGQYNGLSSPSGIEFNVGDMIGAYAGDYQGNVWKFSLDTSSGLWKSTPQKFYSAKGPTGTAQPITSQIFVKRHPAGGVMLLFGTGKFFETADRSDKTVQSFYGLRDIGSAITTGRTQLVQQTLLSGLAVDTDPTRTVTNNAVDWNTSRGWYLDFNSTIGGSASGERVVSLAVPNFDHILFNTYAPGANACTGAGGGFLMALNAFTGGLTPNVPLFDLDHNGVIDNVDLIGGRPAAGLRLANPSLKSVSTMTVTTAAPGSAAGSSTTCGGNGMAPCVSPAPACEVGLNVVGGLCVPVQCKAGNIQVSSGGAPVCMSADAARYPRWIELN